MRCSLPSAATLLWLVACTDAPATGAAGGASSGGSAAGTAAAGTAGDTSSGGSTAGSAGSSGAGTSVGGAGAGGSAGAAGGGGAGQAGTAPVDPNAPDPSPGCGSQNPLPEGDVDIQVGDLMRSYTVRLPVSYDASKALPLVLALHPNETAPSYWDGMSGDRALRPLLADKALLVLPHGRLNENNANDWRGDVPLDLAYFDALIEEIESRLCVDLKRIFAIGFSGGGSFAGALGCYRPDIRAFAAGGAVIYFEEAECTGTAAAWITIGDEEAVQGRLDYRDFFRTDAGCAETTASVDPEPCVAYDCPDPERPVHFCSHPGGHVWPTFGTQAAWDFFAQF
jgi:polyhydroxybutyrate depolymerase